MTPKCLGHIISKTTGDTAGNAEFEGVDNAGVNISARYGKGGHCGSGQISTIWRGWTLQEWTYRHDVAGVDFAGVDNAGVVKSAIWAIGYFNNRFMDFNGLFVAALMGNKCKKNLTV